MKAVLLALLLLSVPALAGAKKHQHKKAPARKAGRKKSKPAAPKDPSRPARETGQTAMA